MSNQPALEIRRQPAKSRFHSALALYDELAALIPMFDPLDLFPTSKPF